MHGHIGDIADLGFLEKLRHRAGYRNLIPKARQGKTAPGEDEYPLGGGVIAVAVGILFLKEEAIVNEIGHHRAHRDNLTKACRDRACALHLGNQRRGGGSSGVGGTGRVGRGVTKIQLHKITAAIGVACPARHSKAAVRPEHGRAIIDIRRGIAIYQRNRRQNRADIGVERAVIVSVQIVARAAGKAVNHKECLRRAKEIQPRNADITDAERRVARLCYEKKAILIGNSSIERNREIDLTGFKFARYGQQRQPVKALPRRRGNLDEIRGIITGTTAGDTEFVDRHARRRCGPVIGTPPGLGLGVAPSAIRIALEREANWRGAEFGHTHIGRGQPRRRPVRRNHGPFIAEELDHRAAVDQRDPVRETVLQAGRIHHVIVEHTI